MGITNVFVYVCVNTYRGLDKYTSLNNLKENNLNCEGSYS